MIRLLIKEIILGVVILVGGLLFFQSIGLAIWTKWIIFSFVLTALFTTGTVLFKLLKLSKSEWTGLSFAGITLVNQLILLILLFIFLEPEETNHRIVAKVGIGIYLIFLGIDTFWKLKWLLPPKTNGDSAGNI
jgi:hypothetical protein